MIACSANGLDEAGDPLTARRCQITDHTPYVGQDCNSIAFFDESYFGINEEGNCSFGYNDAGSPAFKPLEDWDGDRDTIDPNGLCKFQAAGDFLVKGYLDDGILHLLFSDDGGDTFYNAAEPRLALNVACN